jgi:hypothetical protein
MSIGVTPGNCLFPTAKRTGDKNHFAKVVISGLNGVSFSLDEVHHSQRNRFQAAWALLLRSYLGEHAVSFGIVITEGNTNDYTEECVHDLSPQAFVLSYELYDNCMLENISPIGHWPVRAEEFKDLKINTAIKFNSENLSDGNDFQETALGLLNGVSLVQRRLK